MPYALKIGKHIDSSTVCSYRRDVLGSLSVHEQELMQELIEEGTAKIVKVKIVEDQCD